MKEKPNMNKFFKGSFLRIRPEVAPGGCPHCEEMSSFVSIVRDTYRCMSCGFDVEQKVNGVIRYSPVDMDIVLEHEPKA